MRRLAALTLATLPAIAPVLAQTTLDPERSAFVVSAIRVEGLERVSEGTLFNYLPANIGDRLSAARVRECVRALFATGFFRDVQMRRDGSTLVVVVAERPSIASFEITGNKDIKTEDLQKSLRNVGLATGKIFDRAVLEDVTQYLTDQYFSRGKYGVRVATHVDEEPGNRVKVRIEIREGKRAKIRQINIVGNQRFSDVQLLDGFELHTPHWTSWYKQDDRYSRESLQGDLEKLRSFYMDRGYANFRIESQQVAIAPERDDIFITVNVDEGQVFRLSEVKLAGTFVVPEAELRQLLRVAPGQIFSRKEITATQELLQNRLGADGYAFAKVDPVLTPDNDSGAIALTFFIDPATRVYVRNISFSGVTRTNDEVLRRELRQLEGGWLSNVALERSKQRIQRLPYVKKVDSETTPVPGSPDLVDLDFKVDEGPSAQLGGGLGYSGSQGFALNGNVADANFLGKGERVALDLNAGSYSKLYSFSHTDPYVTADGIGRTASLSYSDVRRLTASFSDFSTKTWLAALDLTYPITERQSMRFGTSLQHAELATLLSSSTQLQDWVKHNGDPFFRALGSDLILGTRADLVELSAGWGFDSRDRTLFPTQGAAHRLLLTTTAPGSPIEYLTATYQYQQFFRLPLPNFVPLLSAIPFSFDTHLSYATALGATTDIPPSRHFFAGGPDSVRGFKDYTLGPRDSLGNPYGGDAALTGQLEAILPLAGKYSTTTRVSLFFDFGQAFYVGSTEFVNKIGNPVDYRFSLNALRTSAGIGVQWLAPLGLFQFSFAYPLQYRRESWKNYGDEVERFQFTIGKAF
jgi:outer membrane protein insertion porin family